MGTIVIHDDIRRMHQQLIGWRRDLHAHPELAFEEERTSSFVASKLQAWGLEVHCGLANTGVVGVLKAGEGKNRAIGLRADMDALPILEMTGLPYKSTSAGKMHACGHDGHTTMLLGAARHLGETKRFDGTVYFIFQPAEEVEGGGRAMVEDGLFDRFPMSAVYGLHNWPGLPVGTLAVRPGAMMASMDNFEIEIAGLASHAAMPHLGRDPIIAAANLVSTLQSLVSRNVSPTDPIVVSVTQIHAGDTWNAIPETVVVRGTVRALDPTVQDQAEDMLGRICNGLAAAHDVAMGLSYRRGYPVTINSAPEAHFAREVAEAVLGPGSVRTDLPASMGAEDFAFMLRERPGSYAWLGNGSAEHGRILHNPHYDFNDDILPIGVAYWTELVERAMPAKA